MNHFPRIWALDQYSVHALLSCQWANGLPCLQGEFRNYPDVVLHDTTCTNIDHFLASAHDQTESNFRPDAVGAAGATIVNGYLGMRLGLGSGSTARHFVDLLGERVRSGLRVTAVATSAMART